MLLTDEWLFLSPDQPASYEASGGFARKIMILLADEQDVSRQKEFLSKVLAAVQMNLENDALLSMIPEGALRKLSLDLHTLKPRFVLIFGIPPAQLGLSIAVQAYQPFSFYGCTWIFADTISRLEPDKTKKMQLWSALKKVFEV